MFPNTFPDRAVISETMAKMLLEIDAVHFRADAPFTFTSGLASPVYIDCRKLISYPRIRSAVMDFGASIILRDVGFEQFDAVAGGETAGIPLRGVACRPSRPADAVCAQEAERLWARRADRRGAEGWRAGPSGGGPDHRRRQQDQVRGGDRAHRGACHGHLRGVLLRHLSDTPQKLRMRACACTTWRRGGTS